MYAPTRNINIQYYGAAEPTLNECVCDSAAGDTVDAQQVSNEPKENGRGITNYCAIIFSLLNLIHV